MAAQQIKVIKRKVKYPRLELKTGIPILIIPQKGFFDPQKITSKHQKWLEKKINFIREIENKYKDKKLYQRSEEDLIKLINKFVKKFSKVLNVKPQKINFRYMKTKWGSCSKKGRICFNLALKYLPSSLISYVVFHEMVHLFIPNHSKNFWLKIKKEFKNPSLYEEKLYGYWFLLNKKCLSNFPSLPLKNINL